LSEKSQGFASPPSRRQRRSAPGAPKARGGGRARSFRRGALGADAAGLPLRWHPGCALAWTLTERDFNGEPLLLRVLGLGEFLQDRGWRPAVRRVRASTLLHRSGGGQQVVTQLWQR